MDVVTEEKKHGNIQEQKNNIWSLISLYHNEMSAEERFKLPSKH